MMNTIEALILGFIQGITEFLPISSTAHVVIVANILNIQTPGFMLEIFLHLGSVTAVILYFRRDIWTIIMGSMQYIRFRNSQDIVAFRFGWHLILTTLVSGVFGYQLSERLEEAIKTPPVIAFSLFITGLLLIFIERIHSYGNKNEATMDCKDSLVVALGQTAAVLPGISRSGSTLVASLWTGLNRETAVRYSFLLAIPITLGSTVLLVPDTEMLWVHDIGYLPLLTAFISSFICSLIGIVWLIDFLRRGRLLYFAIYCFVLALLVILFLDPFFYME